MASTRVRHNTWVQKAHMSWPCLILSFPNRPLQRALHPNPSSSMSDDGSDDGTRFFLVHFRSLLPRQNRGCSCLIGCRKLESTPTAPPGALHKNWKHVPIDVRKYMAVVFEAQDMMSRAGSNDEGYPTQIFEKLFDELPKMFYVYEYRYINCPKH
ncbi:hypothetical protein B0T17DRAFT_510494 [Bombardia bombarda]|uniref:Uncharacterized protein n=1 Tax=Bombardia bombarda TaxID=252184 RepID=A0AA39WIC7_9PEZI|nr:hypothetical protein B0T17DRAFT_510494 [Bombardia bombarda]